MPFSNTTTKAGVIQVAEFWTGLGDAGISGNATLLKIFTALVNNGLSRLMPLVLSYCDHIRWDDINHTDKPVATYPFTSASNSYKLSTDDNSLNVLNITKVLILPSASATEYVELKRMTMDDPDAPLTLSPNASQTGIPTRFLEFGNTICFDVTPNYSGTAKVLFERDPSYFASTDTTKEPGIPRPFHELLPLYASYDWLLVNKPDNTALITRIESRIAGLERGLKDLISARTPTKIRMVPAHSDCR